MLTAARRMHNFRLRLVIPFALAAAIAACGGDGPSSGTGQSAAGRVGVVLAGAGLPQYQQFEAALRTSLADRSQDIVVQSADLDPSRQRQLLTDFTAQKARAIIVIPLDSTGLTPAIANAYRAGIPVFTVDMPVPGARTATHVETDFRAAGFAAASYLAGFLPAGSHAAIIGHAGAHGARELVAGFRDSTGGQLRIAKQVGASGGDRARAAEAMTAALGEDPDLDAVFALDPLSALGAMDAAYARRRADIVIVTYGSSPEVLDAIRQERPIRIAVVPRLDVAARQLAEVVEIQLGGKPVTPSIKVPVRLVNVDSLRKP